MQVFSHVLPHVQEDSHQNAIPRHSQNTSQSHAASTTSATSIKQHFQKQNNTPTIQLIQPLASLKHCTPKILSITTTLHPTNKNVLHAHYHSLHNKLLTTLIKHHQIPHTIPQPMLTLPSTTPINNTRFPLNTCLPLHDTPQYKVLKILNASFCVISQKCNRTPCFPAAQMPCGFNTLLVHF